MLVGESAIVEVGGDRLECRPQGLAERLLGPEDVELREISGLDPTALGGRQAGLLVVVERGVGRRVGKVEEAMADAQRPELTAHRR